MPFAVGIRVSPCEEAMSRVATGNALPGWVFFDLPKRKDIMQLWTHVYERERAKVFCDTPSGKEVRGRRRRRSAAARVLGEVGATLGMYEGWGEPSLSREVATKRKV
jgi:hypothetical protein